MRLSFGFETIALVALLTVTALTPKLARSLVRRSTEEWALDSLGLLVQGIAVPLLQTGLIYKANFYFWPSWKGVIDLPGPFLFLLHFIGIDYLYYWNHRWLHTRVMWRSHAVHHTPERLDVLVTSRNTFWSPLVIVYVWANAFLLFVSSKPIWIVASMSTTAALDLWRHSALFSSTVPYVEKIFSKILILPRQHAWHHSRERANCNFGANFSLWDRLHRTFYNSEGNLPEFGIPLPLSFVRKLLFPFG